MSKQIRQYFKLLFILFCLFSPFSSEAANSNDTKVLPITANSYQKDNTGVKKAVPSNKTSNTKISNSKTSSTTVSNPKTTSNSTYNNNTTKNTASANNSKTSSNTSEKNTKILSKSSIKVTQPQKLKEEKTSRKDRISEPNIKVKLGGNHMNVSVKLPYGGQINNSKGKRIKVLKKDETFTWTSVIDKKAKKKKIDYLNETLIIKPAKDVFIFNNNEYRGKVSLKLTENGANVVNELPIEDYLRGVVGREIGSNSPDESLKAQSVIARTYAYAHKGRHGADGADVCNTTHCQVYFGKSAERDSVDKAIKNTRGYILTYNGNPISALYHATCGGMTSNNEEVWGGAPEPFLRRVICNYCSDGTKFRWNYELDINKLRTALSKEGVKLGDVYNISIEAPAQMDRVTYMVFKTNNGEQKIRGTTVRRIFDLPSTTFVLGNRTEKINKIVSAKNDAVVEQPSFLEYEGKSNIFITGFSQMQNSPRQLLVYTSSGLKRATTPEGGWKCISYKQVKRGIAILPENVDNKDIGNSNSNNLVKTLSLKSHSKKEPKQVTKVNLFGRGFGHQVGLCQSGAVGMGKQGWNYRQILAHYYQGVALKKLGY